MHFVAISDTHGFHEQINLPKGDVLIHAGDVTREGTEKEVRDFLEWFSLQDFKHKIFISGNHDFFLEETGEEGVKKMLPENVIYLCDSGVTVEGVKIWGSPVQPCYYNMAFNRERGEEIREHWELIPDDVDVLVTHGPPHGFLDLTYKNDNAGCKDLFTRVNEIGPKYLVFGHIHEAAGVAEHKDTQFINACLFDVHYNLVRNPIVFSL